MLLGTYAGRSANCVFQCLLEYNVSSSVSVSSWNSWLRRDFLEPVDIMRISSSYSSWCCRSRWKPSLCLLDLIEQIHQIMQPVRIRAVMVAPAKQNHHVGVLYSEQLLTRALLVIYHAFFLLILYHEGHPCIIIETVQIHSPTHLCFYYLEIIFKLS